METNINKITETTATSKVLFYSSVELHLGSEEIDSMTGINSFIVAESVEFKTQSYPLYKKCLDDSIDFLNSKKEEWEDKFATEYKVYALENPAYSKNRDTVYDHEDTYWSEDMMVSIVLVNEHKPKDPWIIRINIKAYEIDTGIPTFYMPANDTIH